MDRIVGTPNFCHPDPLKNPTHWTSRREYDRASLAYVIRVVHNGGRIPWTPIEGTCNIDHQHIQERDSDTTQWVTNTEQLDDDLINAITFRASTEKSPDPTDIDKFTREDMSARIIK